MTNDSIKIAAYAGSFFFFAAVSVLCVKSAIEEIKQGDCSGFGRLLLEGAMAEAATAVSLLRLANKFSHMASQDRCPAA